MNKNKIGRWCQSCGASFQDPTQKLSYCIRCAYKHEPIQGPPSPEMLETERLRVTLLEGFVEECCAVDPQGKTLFAELWPAYRAWCKRHHRRAMGKLIFGDRLEYMGYARYRTGQGRFIRGLTLKEAQP